LATAARVLLYGLLIWVPLPLGSNRPFAWAINGIVITFILALFSFGEFGRRRRLDIDWRPAAVAALLFLLVVCWMIIQSVPGVPVALQHPIWSELAGETNNRWAAISINPGSTWTTVAQVAPAGFLAVVAMCLAFDPRRAMVLLRVVVFVSVAVAAYGLVAQYIGFRQVFLLDSDSYAGFLTGTFVNRNSAATYFVIGVAASTSLIAARLEGVLRTRIGRPRNGFLETAELLRRAGIFLVADLVLVAALLNTGSRGGIIAAGLALVAVLIISLRRGSADRRGMAVAFIAVVGVLFAVAAVSSDLLLGRLQTGVGSEDRLNAYRDTLDMIVARPWLGHGAGTFVDAYPLFHSRASSLDVWTHAHDSYLQAIAELGIPAFALLLLAILVVVVTLIRNVGRMSEPQPVATAALAALAGIAFHSVVDFSIQIQAVGVTAWVLVGAGLGETLACEARCRVIPASAEGAGSIRAFQLRETINVTIPVRPPQKQTAATS
jgi:O-antigen ligase